MEHRGTFAKNLKRQDNPTRPSVYELAVASAKEARRLNLNCLAAQGTHCGNLVQAAIERVLRGDVLYVLNRESEDRGPGGGGGPPDGHS